MPPEEAGGSAPEQSFRLATSERRKWQLDAFVIAVRNLEDDCIEHPRTRVVGDVPVEIVFVGRHCGDHLAVVAIAKAQMS